MKNIILILAFVSYYSSSFAQYSIIGEVITEDSIPAETDLYTIHYKIKDNVLFQFRNINATAETYDLKVTKFDVNTGHMIHSDTFLNMERSFKIQGICFDDKFMFISSYEKYFYYEFDNIDSTIIYQGFDKEKFPPYRFCSRINDSLILLYIIYNFHPLDGKAGLCMSILNNKNHKIVKSIYKQFQGIAISHLNANWLTICKDKIYIATPLTAKVFVYDCSLNLVNESSLPLFDGKDFSNNERYELYLDSIVSRAHKQVEDIKKSVTIDSFKKINFSSKIYSKDFISNTIDTTRKKHVFIENVFAIDDSLIAFCISRPEYKDQFKDLLLYDPLKNKIVKKYIKWPVRSPDVLEKIEDVLPISLSSSSTQYPYFKNNHVYVGTVFSSKFLKKGSTEELDEHVYNIVSKEGYKWTILKYELQ